MQVHMLAVIDLMHDDGTGMPTRLITRAHGPRAWYRLLWQRVLTLWFLKMVSTTVAISGFFVLYFWTMESTAHRAVTVPLSAVDAWVGLQQWTLVPYGSLWLYVSLAPAFAANTAALRAYAAGAAAIVVLAMATYWLFPTATPTFDVDWSQHPMLQFLKSADAGGNAFPSLHVAFAFYTALVIASQLGSLGAPRWARGLNWAWCAAIVHSTLATHQHVFLDVLGGLATTYLALTLIWSEPARAFWQGRRGHARRGGLRLPGLPRPVSSASPQTATSTIAGEFQPRPLRRISRR